MIQVDNLPLDSHSKDGAWGLAHSVENIFADISYINNDELYRDLHDAAEEFEKKISDIFGEFQKRVGI